MAARKAKQQAKKAERQAQAPASEAGASSADAAEDEVARAALEAAQIASKCVCCHCSRSHQAISVQYTGLPALLPYIYICLHWRVLHKLLAA